MKKKVLKKTNETDVYAVRLPVELGEKVEVLAKKCHMTTSKYLGFCIEKLEKEGFPLLVEVSTK